jgi:TetR/AcrR family transcriptional repressor of nem operon
MPRVKLFKEEEVLQKAIELFWKKGYTATSIQDLVDSLGINRASLYDTFGGKEALFYKAFQQYRLSSLEKLRCFFEQHDDVKAAFRALFETAINESVCDCDRKGCFVVNTTTELIPGDEEILKVLQENKKALEALFYEVLKRGVEKGQLSPDKDLKALAASLFTFHNGLKVVSKLDVDQEGLGASVNTILQLLD